MPFIVYPNNFFTNPIDADSLSFNSEYFKLPYDSDVNNSVPSLTLAFDEVDQNITNPNIPRNLQKPIPSIIVLILPKEARLDTQPIMELVFQRAGNYQNSKILCILPTNDDGQETVLQAKMDRNNQAIELVIVDCWLFSATPKDAATTCLSVAQKIIKHSTTQTGAVVRNGGGPVRPNRRRNNNNGRNRNNRRNNRGNNNY